jgi:hypothetical protein
MNWLKNLFANLFGKKSSEWDTANYGKPSTAGDEFRNNNTNNV